jgi:hypothetical protein
MSQFEIDATQINPLQLGPNLEELEAQREAAAAEETLKQQNISAQGQEGDAKQAAFETGGRNQPNVPTSNDGTLDYLQTTPDEQRAEGVKKSTEQKTALEATKDMAVGGVMDAAEGLWTFIPRTIDMFTGKADREGETYRPDGMFFDEEKGIDYNPITQQTSWGKMGRDLVAFGATTAAVAGTIALATAAAPAIGLGAGVVGVLGAIGMGARSIKLATIAGKGAAFLGGTGMIVDAIDMKSADHNMAGSIADDNKFIEEMTKKYPFIMNPIATNDTDSIFTKTWKNVLEAGMMGGILGKAFGVIVKPRVAKEAAEGVPSGKPVDNVTPPTPEKQIVHDIRAERMAKIKAAAVEQDEKLLRDAVALKYKRTTKGKQFFDELPADKQQELMKMEYLKQPDKYPNWSPDGEFADERVVRKVVEMNKSQNDQVTEAAYEQLDLPGMGGYKNKGTITDAQQGNTLSGNTIRNIDDQLHAKRNTYGGEYGSTDTLIRPAAILRANKIADIEGKELQEIAEQMYGKERYSVVIDEIREQGMTPREIFPEAFEKAKELFEDRNTTELSAEEFWKSFDDEISFRTGGPESRDAWYMKNVVAADLANGTLYSQMRDLGIAAREANAVLDPFDVDGPAQQILEQLEYGLFNVKKSRMLWSGMGRELQTELGAEKAKEAMKRKLTAIRQEAKDQVKLMKELATKAPSKELSDTMLEIFSWSNDIRNWEDVAEVFRKRLRGGEYNGKKYDSMVIKELQGVIVNSVLTGPKTPIRAIMGTATATFLRPMSQVIGGMGTLDKAQINEGLAALSGAIGAIPDSWKLFKRNLNAYWSGEMSTIKTRYGILDKRDEAWQAMGEFMMENGSDADKAAYLMGNFARGLNDQKLLTYSTKIMGATDDAFGYIMARSRSKVKAMQDALEAQKLGKTPEVTPKLMKAFEDSYMADFIDPKTGRINAGADVALDHAAKEATLTRDLSGFSKGFADLFSKNPWTKPFFLFARTGINGIKLTMSHMPMFKYMLGDERRILNATMDMAEQGQLADLGIANAADLMNAKAIQRGRTIIGGSIISMAAQKVMAGELTGNGSADRGVREAQRMGDWKPRSIKIGDKWISYDSFEPFNTILAYVADSADSMEMMGQEWVEDKFQKAALALVGSGVSKTYLSGLTQIVDLLSGEPGQIELMAAGLVNNTVPLGALRNEVGKVVNPYMKELNREFDDQVRNRNQISELVAGEPLPIKYDILTGKPIRDWNLPTRLFNAFSPVQINLDYSPGRTLLFNSGYDMRTIALKPDGIDLSGSPSVRSAYQQELGKQNLEEKLNRLANDPRTQQSLENMEQDKMENRWGKEPKDYWINIRISKLFAAASANAWAKVSKSPEAQRLIEEKRLLDQSRKAQRMGQTDLSNQRYDDLQELRNMPK